MTLDENNSNNKNEEIELKERNITINKKKLFEPIGILDPSGIRNNPLTGQPYENMYYNPKLPDTIYNKTYEGFSSKWASYPMYEKRETSINTIYNNQVILIVSGTGSGKTVLTPKFALHTLNYQGRIAITNPKRTPSKKNAEFAAMCMDVKLGTFVGMKYRGSDPSSYSSNCNLIYTTDGWVLQKLMKDPMLKELDMVIIDEAHERGINIDLLLLLLKELLLRRPTFKLIIMSATINAEIFTNYFPQKEFKYGMIDAGEIPNYPIKEIFIDRPINRLDPSGIIINDEYIESAVDKVIMILMENPVGDILVFFPGKKDTNEGSMLLHKKLEKINKSLDSKIFCSSLTASTDSQTERLLTNANEYKRSGQYTRKVIFATDVAESSMTFPGVDFIVDTGLAHKNIFYAEKNMEAIEKKYIAKSSHKQRKGRTGRTGPGTCYNLFTLVEYNNFKDFTLSPILSEDISSELTKFLSNNNLITHINFPIVYNTKHNDMRELSTFLSKFIEAPLVESVQIIMNRLLALDIIHIENNVGRITDLGRAVAAFETLPEIGRMIISGYNHRCRDDIINLAAILDVVEFRMDGVFQRFRPSSKNNAVKKAEKKIYENTIHKWANSMGDHFSLIHIYNEFCKYKYDRVNRKTGVIIQNKKGDAKQWCDTHFLHYKTLENVKEVAQHINQKFGKVMSIYREKNPTTPPTYIFMDEPPIISEKTSDNIIRAITDGFYINLLKKSDNLKYTNCFPLQKTIGGFSRESLFATTKSPTIYALYTQLKSILGKTNYAIISKIPPNIIEDIQKSNKYKYIEYCIGFKQSPQQHIITKSKQHLGKKPKQHVGKKSKKNVGKKLKHHISKQKKVIKKK